MTRLFGSLGLVLVGVLLAYIVLPSEPVAYPEVIVPAARIIEREMPARPPTIVERIVYVNVPPRQVARAIGGAQDNVASFCRPTVLAMTDTLEVQVPAPELLLRSGQHQRAPIWKLFARGNLMIAGPTSHGDLAAADYPVRAGYAFRTSGDSALVRYPRGAFVRDVIEDAAEGQGSRGGGGLDGIAVIAFHHMRAPYQQFADPLTITTGSLIIDPDLGSRRLGPNGNIW